MLIDVNWAFSESVPLKPYVIESEHVSLELRFACVKTQESLKSQFVYTRATTVWWSLGWVSTQFTIKWSVSDKSRYVQLLFTLRLIRCYSNNVPNIVFTIYDQYLLYTVDLIHVGDLLKRKILAQILIRFVCVPFLCVRHTICQRMQSQQVFCCAEILIKKQNSRYFHF